MMLARRILVGVPLSYHQLQYKRSVHRELELPDHAHAPVGRGRASLPP